MYRNLFQETKAVLNVERQAIFQGNVHLQEVGFVLVKHNFIKSVDCQALFTSIGPSDIIGNSLIF